jgi:hypothetical protein
MGCSHKLFCSACPTNRSHKDLNCVIVKPIIFYLWLIAEDFIKYCYGIVHSVCCCIILQKICMIFLRQSVGWRKVLESVSHNVLNLLFHEKHGAYDRLHTLQSKPQNLNHDVAIHEQHEDFVCSNIFYLAVYITIKCEPCLKILGQEVLLVSIPETIYSIKYKVLALQTGSKRLCMTSFVRP